MGGKAVFRLFISSTFEDMEDERNKLQDSTLPQLEKYCKERGATFQPVDLRWGVSEAAGQDHQAMNICLGEIRRCQAITPRPNFLVLLGQRYGWKPLPTQIRDVVFENLLGNLSGEERKIIEEWYQKDENSVPAEYVLLPRGDAFRKYADWEPKEKQLYGLLFKGIKGLGLSESEMLPFRASATHQEIVAGALNVENPAEKVICIFRSISQPKSDDEGIKKFIDGTKGTEELGILKKDLINLFPEKEKNVVELMTEWSPEKQRPTKRHLEELDRQVYKILCSQIDLALEISNAAKKDPEELIPTDALLDEEGLAHRAVAEKHLKFFQGRHKEIVEISNYIDNPDHQVFLLHGEGGTGKTALISRSIQKTLSDYPETVVVYRFLGTTPQSSNPRELLFSVCQELCRRFKKPEDDIPQEYNGLVSYFKNLLVSAEVKTILFIDALDQIDFGNGSSLFNWIPQRMPHAVALVLSIRSGVGSRPEIDFPSIKELTLEGLQSEEGEKLLTLWLKDAGRDLQPLQSKIVMKSFVDSKFRPLYLRLVFEEAKKWRSWEEVVDLGSGASIIENFYKYLCQEENHGRFIVRSTLSYLSASRNGLSEEELLDLLSRDLEVYIDFLKRCHHFPHDLVTYAKQHLGKVRERVVSEEETEQWLWELCDKPENTSRLEDFVEDIPKKETLKLPIILLARLRADLGPYLTERFLEGHLLIDFYHRELKNVAIEKFLNSDPTHFHDHLSSYFLDRADPGGNYCWKGEKRYIGELPYHLTKAENWELLIGNEKKPGIMTDLRFIQAKSEAGMVYDLVREYNDAIDALPEFREEKEFLRERSLAMQSYNRSLKTYATQRYEFLRKRDKGQDCEEPAYPDLPNILEEENRPEHPEESSPRAARLKHFANFVKINVSFLSNHPEGVLPLAYNSAKDYPVSEQAELFLQDDTSPWFKLENRPDSPPLRPQCILEIQGHEDCLISGAILAHDGRHALSWAEDCEMCLWDLQNGRLLKSLDVFEPFGIHAVVLTPDGRRAFWWSQDGALSLWDLEKGKRIKALMGHKAAVIDVVVSPDGRLALSWDQDGELCLWDLEKERLLKDLCTYQPWMIHGVAFTSDGCRVLKWGQDCTLCLWDFEKDEEHRVFSSPNDRVFSWVLPFGGHRPLSWNDPRMRCLCDLNKGEESRILSEQEKSTSHVVLAPDGRSVLSWCQEGTLRLWDLEKGGEFKVLSGQEDWVRGAVFTPDGRRILSWSQEGTLRLWDLEKGGEPRVFSGHVGAVFGAVISSDGLRALSWSVDSTLRLWDLEKDKEPRVFSSLNGSVKFRVFSPDGRRALSWNQEGVLSLWDLEKVERIKDFWGQEDWVRGAVFTPDGRRALSWSQEGTLRLWDLEKGEPVKVFSGHNAPGSGVLSPDGRHAILWSQEGTLRLWDLEKGEPKKVFSGHKGSVYGVVLGPDGRRSLSWGASGTLLLWDLDKGREPRSLSEQEDWMMGAAFTPDGRRAISWSQEGTLRLWDLEKGEPIKVFSGHKAPVYGVVLSPDGRRAISWSCDDTLRLWNLETSEAEAIYRTNKTLRKIRFQPRGKRIVCQSDGCHLFFLITVRLFLGPPILTAFASGQYQCPCCSFFGRLKSDTLAIIQGYQSDPSRISPPEEAFSDVRLVVSCPECGGSMKLNPFFVYGFPQEV